MNMFDLTGKFAIVTGARHGLGYAISEGLASQGADVTMVDIGDDIHTSAETLRQKGLSVQGYVCDLSDRAARARLIEDVAEQKGRLDILVNNAGIQIRHPALEFPLDDWDKVLEINLTAIFDLCQKAGQIMAKQGRGKIVNVGSVNSLVGGINTTAYVSAKGGVAMLTKGLSNEWSSKGINVNCLAPGYTETPMNTALINDTARYESLKERIPLGRWAQPQDMAGAVVFLSSPASDYVCGIVLPVDGGYLGR